MPTGPQADKVVGKVRNGGALRGPEEDYDVYIAWVGVHLYIRKNRNDGRSRAQC